MNLETIKKDRIDSGGFVGYERELINQLEEQDREIERLLEIIKILKALRRNDQHLTDQAEAKVKELEKKLGGEL